MTKDKTGLTQPNMEGAILCPMTKAKRRKGEASKIKPSDKTTLAAVIRNPDCYFKEGISFSRTGYYAPTYRLNASSVFDMEGSCVFQREIPQFVLLSVMASILQRYVQKSYIDHTVHTQVEDVKDAIVPRRFEKDCVTEISTLVEMIVNRQRADPKYNYWSNEQKRIDALMYQLYGFNQDDIREVELWYCRRYPKLAEAQGALTEVKQKYGEHLKKCELVMTKGPDYWKSNPVLALIAQGEGETLEFKETLDVDAKTGEKNPGVLVSSLKTIAAFLNTNGGTLIIGISDSGEIIGLEKDYKLCNKHDKDGLEQKIHSLAVSRFVPQPTVKINVSFEHPEDKQVCVVSIEKSKEIIHLDGKEVYVREGNTTHKLEGPALTSWVKNRS